MNVCCRPLQASHSSDIGIQLP